MLGVRLISMGLRVCLLQYAISRLTSGGTIIAHRGGGGLDKKKYCGVIWKILAMFISNIVIETTYHSVTLIVDC